MFQKLIFKPRSKSNKNCIKDSAKNNKKKKTKVEKETEDSKPLDDREKVEKEEDKSRDEKANTAEGETARESETMTEREAKCEEDRRNDDGIEISMETVTKKDGGASTRDKEAENGTEEEALDGEGSKVNGEPSENKEFKEVMKTVATVESKTKEKENEGRAEVEVVIENGVETDEEKDEGGDNAVRCKTEESVHTEIIAKEIVVDPQATCQSPEETQE